MKKIFLLAFLIFLTVNLYSQVPGVPIIISPADSATLCPPYIFDWYDVPTATSYHIQFSLNINFTALVIDEDVSVSQYTFPGGLGNTYYYWRVRASNSYGSSSYTPVRSVIGGTLVNPPALVSPPNGAINVPINGIIFNYNPAGGATSYIFQLSKSLLFDSLIVNDTTPLGSISLVPNTTYYWRMCSISQPCGAGNWSAAWSFTTAQQAPYPPALLSPADSSVIPVTGQIFDWSDVPGATSYRIQISTTPNFSNTVINQVTGSSSQYTHNTPVFQNNTMYYWRVNATNSGGTGAWSTVWRVITVGATLPPPVCYPVNRGKPVYSDSATIFEWHKVPTATSYRIQISTSPAFANTSINEIVYDTIYIAPPYSFNNYSMYYWRVAAINSGGQGSWSAVWSFYIYISLPNPPTLFSPINNSTNVSLTPSLFWRKSIGTNVYRVQVSAFPTFSNLIINNPVSDSTYLIPSGKLLNNTQYYWRVNATNASGTSTWSDVWTFTTINQIGISVISSEIPAEYKLYNNYPNPFNPTTNIKYQIRAEYRSQNTEVRIVVYDVIGKLIETLVNEKQSPGIYEVTFDGRNLPSGIYYYTIRAGGFTDTKRMMLLK